ncbi:hypothetical protein C8R47DRAFT_157010 [Mycena vitilis]|nr:hypothetical protein C8R47DRAFT_157010 [Mycena vitilis]
MILIECLLGGAVCKIDLVLELAVGIHCCLLCEIATCRGCWSSDKLWRSWVLAQFWVIQSRVRPQRNPSWKDVGARHPWRHRCCYFMIPFSLARCRFAAPPNRGRESTARGTFGMPSNSGDDACGRWISGRWISGRWILRGDGSEVRGKRSAREPGPTSPRCPSRIQRLAARCSQVAGDPVPAVNRHDTRGWGAEQRRVAKGQVRECVIRLFGGGYCR